MTYRYNWVAISLGVVLLVLAALSNADEAGAAAADPTNVDRSSKPNFILLFMDDLGYGDMGFTGHPTTHTPNLDRLAWDGMVLTTWYSACAACTVSFVSDVALHMRQLILDSS